MKIHLRSLHNVLAIAIALSLSLSAIAQEPTPTSGNIDAILQQAARHAQRDESAQAIELFSQAIKVDPKLSIAYYLRGRENFCAGNVAASVADFDKHIELSPDAESRQWERGISYYYNGEFEKGAKQFEMYQTYHDQDVENSAWRYLCVAKVDGVEKARESMLPIENDSRVPMMEIYKLYRGELKPEDIMQVVKRGNPPAEALNNRLFYAHLYIGLWYEVAGETTNARLHITEAEKHKIGHYMWDVAHVHAEKLRAAEAAAEETAPVEKPDDQPAPAPAPGEPKSAATSPAMLLPTLEAPAAISASIPPASLPPASLQSSGTSSLAPAGSPAPAKTPRTATRLRPITPELAEPPMAR